MGFEESDIIINLKSSDGILSTAQAGLFIKKKGEFEQVGLVQSLDLKADVRNHPVNLTVTFPAGINNENALNLMREHKDQLKELGCEII